MSHHSDPDTPMVALVGLVGAVLLFAIVVALTALYKRTEHQQLQDKVVEPVPQELAGLRARQQAQLVGYRHLPGDGERVALPIERAMELVVAELNTPQAPLPEPEVEEPAE